MPSRPPGSLHEGTPSTAPDMNTTAPILRNVPPNRIPDFDRVREDRRKRQKLSHSPGEAVATPAGERLRVPVKSQESTSSDRSASKWFDKAKNNVTHSERRPSTLDEDPPFYIADRSNYVPPSYAAAEGERLFGGVAAASRMESENEDLRSVIDDLTVENKRLKHILRAQHRQQKSVSDDPAHSQPDRLFEIRMHGLPAEKRKELEYLLTNFATSLHQSTSSKNGTNTSVSASRVSSSSNQTGALLVHTDSGYGSASGSAAKAGNDKSPRRPSQSNAHAVKSYLHDIPDTLLPRRNPVMSEKTKMELVVRRLEQLFTGRKAAPGDHDQPMQQQEVSHSAARAEQLQSDRALGRRKPEGAREARVMPPESRVNLDVVDELTPGHIDTTTAKHKPRTHPDHGVDTGSGSGSPDQRPTRPLDLDIYRAQVSSDNIQYIRHLGMSSPHFDDSSKDNPEGTWMFLNLLTNMAQLHTINVTPDFVRKSIKKYSRRFELSTDGHKVRWMGGKDNTEFPHEDEKAIELTEVLNHETSTDRGNRGSGSRSQSNSTSNEAGTSNDGSQDKTSGMQTSSDSRQRQPTTSGTSNLPVSLGRQTTSSSIFDYKPVVYRGWKLNSSLDLDHVKDSDDSFDSISSDSRKLIHALSRSNLKQKSHDQGTITFFNSPFFCSDFSADKTPSNMRSARPVIAGETLGIQPPPEAAESALRYSDATYFATHFAQPPYQPQGPDDPNLTFYLPDLTPIAEAGESETVPLEFEVCGLGGVTPEDNFVVDVVTELASTAQRGLPATIRRLPFSRRKHSPRYLEKIVSCSTIQLLPSKLPPPSYIFFTSSSSSNVPASDTSTMSSDSNSSSSPFVDEEFPAPPAFLAQFSGGSREHVSDDDGEDSSSIDMLDIARKMAPEQIAEQERVYMITQPGGARKAIAGSLAATVGASQSTGSVQGRQYPAVPGSPGANTDDVSMMEEDGNDDDDDDDANPT